MNKKVTIIGAGLGGLSAGALLSKQGFKVTILEQHNIVGGCATTFKRKNFICEVGLHEMEGVYTNKQIKEIFDTLEVYDNMEFIKVPEFFEVTTKNTTFTMPDDVSKAKNALIDRFKDETEAIEKYFDLIKSISDQLESIQNIKWYHYAFFPICFYTLLRYKNKSVTEVFDTLFKDSELKLILNTNVQYYNDTPDSLSFLLHGVAQYSYFSGGGYFIKGGSGVLSEYLASVIRKNGGDVITKAMVTKCTPKQIVYTKNKETHSLDTDIIISNLSPQDTYELFNEKYTETKEIADSLLTVYIGFSKNIRSVYGKRAYSNFYFDDLEGIDGFNEMLKKDITKRGFVFVDYSQIDSALTTDEEKSFGAVCLSDYLSDWDKLSQEEYELKKSDLETAVVEKLERYYPGISELIEYIEVGTAKTVNRYIKTPKGTAYGFKQTPSQFFKVPKTKSEIIDNLYFAGQWVIAGGFSPSITSGKLCADAISS